MGQDSAGHTFVQCEQPNSQICITVTTVFLQVLLAKEANESGVPHHCVLAHRVVQVQVSSYDVQLDSQKNHQHAGAVHAHDGAGET